MTQPTQSQLMDALRRADAAGDEQAARAIAKRIDAQRKQAQPGKSYQQQVVSGIGNTAANLGSGLMDTAMAAQGGLLGLSDRIWGSGQQEQSNQEREQMRQRSEARNQQFDQNATGLERGAALGSEIAAYAIPAAGIDKKVRAAGVVGRGASQALGAMGLDTVFQAGEGAQEQDAGRTGTVGAATFGAEMISPVLARTGKVMWRAVKKQADSPIEAGREIARQAGYENISDDVAQKIANAADEIEAGARPEAVIAQAEFDLPLTRAQKTGRYDDFDREDLLRPSRQGQPIRNIDEAQAARQGELVDEMTGGLDSPQTAVDNSRRAVRGALKETETAEKAAWDQVRGSDLRLSPQVADEFGKRTRDALKNFPKNEKIVPDAMDALESVDDMLRQGDSIDMQTLQDARSMLSSRAANAATPREAAMLNKAKKAFDDTLKNAGDNVRVSGNLEDVSLLHRAVDSTADKYRRFTKGNKWDDPGAVVEQLVNRDNVDKLASSLLGSSQIAGTSTGDFARALVRTVGKDAPELGQLKQAILLKAAKKGGENVGPQQLSRNIKELVGVGGSRGRRDVLEQLFTKQEIDQLGRMANALDVLWKKPDKIGRSSGSMERAIRYMEGIGGSETMGLSQLGNLSAWIGRRHLAKKAARPLASPTAPLIPAAAAANTSNRPNSP